jgi:hypothetical protein
MNYHKITYHLTALTILLGTALVTASCTDDEVETIAEKKAEATYVTLTVNTGDVAATRSLSFTDEKGSSTENYINPYDVSLFFLPDDGTAVNWISEGVASGAWNTPGSGISLGQVSPTDVVKTGDNVYQLTCELDESSADILKAQTSWRVAVFANCNKPKFTNGQNLLNLAADQTLSQYNYPNVFGTGATAYWPSEETPIPMYGLLQRKNFTLVKGKATNLGTVNMIRSMAKIEVKTEKDAVKLTDVKLATCEARGSYTPFAMWIESDFSEKYDGYYLNIPYEHFGRSTTLPTVSNLAFTQVETDKDYVIYVPEMRQVGTSVEGANRVSTKITLNFNGEAYDIYFKEYDDNGEPKDNTEFNIIRNHIYRYTVEPAPTKISIKYVVEPWTEQTAGDITFD